MSASPTAPPAQDATAPIKRVMKSRACDPCSARRVRCLGEGVPCLSCSRANLACTFNREPRKKGPKGTVLEGLRKAGTSNEASPTPAPLPAPVHAPFPSQPAPLPVEGGRATASDCFSLNSYNLHPAISPASAASADPPPNSLSSLFLGLPSSAESPIIPQHLPMLHSARDPALGWLNIITKSILLPQIDVFYARLHPVLPMIPRNYIMSGIEAQVHLQDPSFAALLLAISALALVGPVTTSERDREEDNQQQALALIEEAMRVKGMVTNHLPTMESIWTPFFLFAALYNCNKSAEAWCRLREALTLADTLELHKQTSYDSLPLEECSRRIRTLWILMVTERAYAMQRNHSIMFTVNTGVGWALRDIPWLQASDPTDVVAMLGLRCLAHLYSFINEDIISCWNGKCLEGVCETLDGPGIVALQRGLDGWAEGFTDESMAQLSEPNRADLLISQQWLRNRIWQLTVSHCLSSDDSPEPELRPSFSLKIAQETIRVCKLVKPAALEANGVGVAHKLHDIVLSIIYANRILSDDHQEPWMISPPLVLGHHLRAELTGLLQSFRGGRHPFLKPVLEMV